MSTYNVSNVCVPKNIQYLVLQEYFPPSFWPFKGHFFAGVPLKRLCKLPLYMRNTICPFWLLLLNDMILSWFNGGFRIIIHMSFKVFFSIFFYTFI